MEVIGDVDMLSVEHPHTEAYLRNDSIIETVRVHGGALAVQVVGLRGPTKDA